MYKRIVVGYDGSQNSERALERATELAKISGGRIKVVTAVDIAPFASFPDPGVYARLIDSAKEDAERMQSAALEKLKEGGINAEGGVLEGSPADAILTSASEFKADLVVVGRRGIRGLKRFLMGSVSANVVNNSNCDVLVVK